MKLYLWVVSLCSFLAVTSLVANAAINGGVDGGGVPFRSDPGALANFIPA